MANWVLRQIGPEYSSRVFVEACGGPIRLRSDEAGRVINHVATGDPVARIGGSFLRSQEGCNVSFHPNQVRRMSIANHAYLGSSYEEVPSRFKEQYAAYWEEEEIAA